MSVSESGVRPILAEAVELARRALLELQPTGVGEHLGVTGENECAATHHFAATLPGYRGWRWEVVVAAAPDADYATVSESALLPGPDALVAPEFVPWEQRIRPGDLAPGDLLAPRVDDPRLVPGYLETGDPVVDEVCEEVGLGRRQVLSREGRLEAAERWYSEFGPDTEMARSAPGTCGVCGFFVPLAGALRSAFGVCANAMGADGRVVHVEYGCGAHSDTELPTGAGSPLYEAYDDAAIEIVPAEERTTRDGSADAEQSAATAGSGAEDPAEDTAEAESPSHPAGDAHVTGDTATAADALPTGADAHQNPGTDPAPEAGAAETVSSGAESPSIPVDDVSATGGSETAEASPAGVAPAEDAPADTAGTSAAVDVTNAASDVTDTAAEPAESDAAADPAAAEADHSTDETAADAGPVRYSDAWAVSAVRVQPGETGAAEEN